ncbi:MAG: hypothetical protein ACI4RL_02330 [Ruminococcus sp.]
MSKISVNEKANYLITKIIFCLNIPLILLYFPVLYLANNSNGVFTSQVPFLEGIVLFIICVAVLILLKGDKGTLLSAIIFDFCMLLILKNDFSFALRLIVSPSIHSESSLNFMFCIIIYYSLACLVAGVVGLIAVFIKQCSAKRFVGDSNG